jgi:hypothetical protein
MAQAQATMTLVLVNIVFLVTNIVYQVTAQAATLPSPPIAMILDTMVSLRRATVATCVVHTQKTTHNAAIATCPHFVPYAYQPFSSLYSHCRSEHRSVSPFGTSRFEQRSPYFSRTSQSYSNPRHSVTTSEVCETPRYGCDGYYGSSDTTMSRSGAGLARSSVRRGRTYDHDFVIPGYSGSS